MKKKLLDTSAIYRTNLDFSQGSYVITNNVLLEITDEITKSVIDSALRNGRIELDEPRPEYLEKVRKAAEKTGDIGRLSGTDIELLALALEKKDYFIVTDDYSIQNMCKNLNIGYERSVQDGIKRKLSWCMVCEGCGRRYDYSTKLMECEICGSKLIKKAD